MSRGIQAEYLLLNTENGIATYAYGGANFNYLYDKTVYHSKDGRICISLDVLDSEISAGDAIKDGRIQIQKPCFYAEENLFGVDIFALRTVAKILRSYETEGKLPQEGSWVC